MKTIRVLDKTGDTVVNFDDPALAEADRKAATDQARELFDRLTGKGASAFSVEPGGKPGTRIKSFDDIQGEVVIVPRIVAG